MEGVAPVGDKGSNAFGARGVWCMVYGVWCMGCGVWLTALGVGEQQQQEDDVSRVARHGTAA